jgi:outer membrane protein OmpA-like peptidoglycan-associated protein
MRGRTVAILLLAGVQGLATGCVATRDFVREVVGQQKAESDQRFTQVETKVTGEVGRVETKLSAESQRIEGMGFRVGKLETSVDEVGTTAKNAQQRADSAVAKADAVDERLTRLWTKRHNRNMVESVDVRFGFNRADLDDGAQTALLNVIREMQSNPQLTVDLSGFTDSVGPRDYNVSLAQRRVESVRRFMVQQGVELPRINSIGLGVLDERGLANDKKRRVTVKLMTPAE